MIVYVDAALCVFVSLWCPAVNNFLPHGLKAMTIIPW